MDLEVDRHSAIPFYFQVKEAIRARIARGDLRPGDLLPSEVRLSERLGLSRLTVHRAYRELAAEGLLDRQRAKGTFVALARRQAFLVEGPLFSLTEDLARDRLEFSNCILVQEVVEAGDEALTELNLAPGGKVVHLLSLRTVKRLPFAVEDMVYPHDRFPEMAGLDLNNRSTYAALERLYDAHPQEALDRIGAGAATAQEARLLGIPVGRPVLRVRRTSRDRSGRPVEFSVVTFHADRYQIVARAHRDAMARSEDTRPVPEPATS